MARYLVCVNILQPLDHHYSSEQRHHRSGRFFDSYFSCSTLDHDLSRVTRPRAARDHRRTRQSFTSFDTTNRSDSINFWARIRCQQIHAFFLNLGHIVTSAFKPRQLTRPLRRIRRNSGRLSIACSAWVRSDFFSLDFSIIIISHLIVR